MFYTCVIAISYLVGLVLSYYNHLNQFHGLEPSIALLIMKISLLGGVWLMVAQLV